MTVEKELDVDEEWLTKAFPTQTAQQAWLESRQAWLAQKEGLQRCSPVLEKEEGEGESN